MSSKRRLQIIRRLLEHLEANAGQTLTSESIAAATKYPETAVRASLTNYTYNHTHGPVERVAEGVFRWPLPKVAMEVGKAYDIGHDDARPREPGLAMARHQSAMETEVFGRVGEVVTGGNEESLLYVRGLDKARGTHRVKRIERLITELITELKGYVDDYTILKAKADAWDKLQDLQKGIPR